MLIEDIVLIADRIKRSGRGLQQLVLVPLEGYFSLMEVYDVIGHLFQISGDMAAQIAKAISEAIKPISERLDQFDSVRKQETRMASIMAKAKEYSIPELIAKRFAGDIKDDEDLDKYFQDRKQELVNIGLAESTPPDTSEQRIEKENEAIAKMINDKTNEMIGKK